MIFIVGLEVQRAGVSDCTEIVLQFLFCHADTVITDLQDPVLFVNVDTDHKIIMIHPHAVVGERAEIELVDRVRGVRNQLTQEDLLVGIDGVDHHIKQFFGFGFELLFRHKYYLFFG